MNALLAPAIAIRQNPSMLAAGSKISGTGLSLCALVLAKTKIHRLPFMDAQGKKLIPLVLAVLALAFCLPAQDQMLKVKGGHQLGETAEQFFSEGQEKEALSSCAAADFKKLEKILRFQLKKHCDDLAATRQLAMYGKRNEYQGAGEPDELREDTFTFDAGHLVKVELIYGLPSLEFNNRGFTFKQIFDGAKQAYGLPTSETTKPVQDQYGVPYTAHRELWLTPSAAILITEKPGPGGSTTLIASTREEYDRTAATALPKSPNPLE